MHSYTHANQARRILQRYGFSSEIQRQERLGKEGCGFLVLVHGDCHRVSDILQKEGIAVQWLQESRDIL